jgi:ssDNA-binding replication factor A large subunit
LHIIVGGNHQNCHCKGKDVQVKAVTLKDSTGKCKVSLWREFANSNVTIGQHVKITDVVVQAYNNEKSVSTTMRTEVEVCLKKNPHILNMKHWSPE